MDGIEGIKRECEKERDAWQRAHPDDYSRSISKIAVAQVCEMVGFDSVRESALEALSNVAVRYMCDLGKSASLYASLAGRSECNIFDIVKGLEDMGLSTCAVSSAAEGKGCVAGSCALKEIAEFVGSVEDVPFAQPIPQFPVVKCRRLIPSFSHLGEGVSGKHIPEWLPAFPDPHTYMHSPVWNEKKMDNRIDKGEQARQRRKAERSLLNLQQRLVCSRLASSGSQHCRVFNDERDTGAAAVTEENAYLAPALSAVEKEVSMVALPHQFANQGDRKPPSVRETFAPVIDALKNGGLDPMEVDRIPVPDRRPVVHFKLKAGKKLLVEDVDIHLRNKVNGKRGPWSPRDIEKDDKKRRAELILRQSIENAQEQSQM